MPYREKADLLAEITAELATFTAPQNGKTVRPKSQPVVEAGCATTTTPGEPEPPKPSTEILRQ